MDNWADISHVARLLEDFPAHWAPIERIRYEGTPSRADVHRGLDIIHRGLEMLGPPASTEPTLAGFADLPKYLYDFALEAVDLRAVSGARLRAFCEARRLDLFESYLCQGITLAGMARAILRSVFGDAAGDILEDVPGYGLRDPEDIGGLTLAWLEQNALLLRDGDQARCMRLMMYRFVMELVPLAKRLYHQPQAGPRVRRAIEEIFTDNVVADIRATKAPTD
jgi:hypothetical protein